MKRVLLAAIWLALAGCQTAPAPRCAAHEQLSMSELIYFGTATPDGAVTDEQWSGFLRDEVTPRFPQGLTTWTASGQWRSQDGSLTREDSHVLNLVHGGDAATEQAVRELSESYKQRFRQEAVLRVKSHACSSLG
jgi:hypothetical protein